MSGKFARIRGRVHGPFSDEKLRTMIRRGQLGRMHEISEDGHAWSRASEYPYLFENPATETSVAVVNTNDPGATKSSPNRLIENPTEWYYAKDDQQFGPISEQELRDMLRNGKLSANDQVWEQGMSTWAAAKSISGLVASATTTAARTTSTATEPPDDLRIHDVRLQQIIGSTRGWILVVLILAYLCVASLIASGIWYTIIGIKLETTAVIAAGLLTVIFAGALSALVALLNRHYTVLGRFRAAVEPADVEAAFGTLKSFWITLAVIMIILFTFLLVAAVMVVAFGINLIPQS